jgi:hypothetical protein
MVEYLKGYKAINRFLGWVLLAVLVIGGITASIVTDGWPDLGTPTDGDFSVCDHDQDSCAYEPEIGR